MSRTPIRRREFAALRQCRRGSLYKAINRIGKASAMARFTPVTLRFQPTANPDPQSRGFFIMKNQNEFLNERNFRSANLRLRILGQTRGGRIVFDRPNSHSHLDLALVREALERIDGPNVPFAKVVVPMGRPVGFTTCVRTTESDEIVYAQRRNRAGHTRFVKGRSPIPCANVVVVLKQTEQDANAYVLITAFVGNDAEPEPWDRNATPAARDYWSRHALVYGSEECVPGTETKQCPWC
jgi:hypothetical protein